jgi:hypothetical protein
MMILGIDEGSSDGDCTIYARIKNGVMHVERIERHIDKCLVFGCSNRKHQGKFIGDLCGPCHQMITTGCIGSGETFIHTLVKEANTNYSRGWDEALDEVIAKAERAKQA